MRKLRLASSPTRLEPWRAIVDELTTHPAEEQKRVAAGKFESFRVAGILEAMEKSSQVATISATVQ